MRKTSTNAREVSAQEPVILGQGGARAARELEPALSVAMVYEDALTWQWATEVWDRIGQFIESGGIRCQSWKVGELRQSMALAQAVQGTAEADVLVISIRDAGELPLLLHVWIDAWLPRRTGQAGAMLALIGVAARPDAPAGGAHRYLESVARRAGMDFLPREFKLPEEPAPVSTTDSAASPATAGGGFTIRAEAA